MALFLSLLLKNLSDIHHPIPIISNSLIHDTIFSHFFSTVALFYHIPFYS